MKKQSLQTELFYEDRFWEQYVGAKLISDPISAIVELVANAWDAGATKVEIDWPNNKKDMLRISDNGESMTKEEFYKRWGTLSYDRSKSQKPFVNVMFDNIKKPRQVFGRNGIGRFAAFCFGKQYTVTIRKNGQEAKFLVKKGNNNVPLDITIESEKDTKRQGTILQVDSADYGTLPATTIRVELGKRFLTDPSFGVFIDNEKIEFEDIKDQGLEKIDIPIPSLGIIIPIKIIDVRRTDRNIRQHGVAWHVLGRLVGDCDWKDPEQKSLIDGRRVEAKRFTFIVEADPLQGYGAVLPDWSGFREENAEYKTINEIVQRQITAKLLETTKEKRQEITHNIRSSYAPQIKEMTPLKREKWNDFVEKIQESCPSLSENELKNVAGVLANMEQAKSQYSLMKKLNALTPDQIDDLHKILEDWTLDMAKAVLDELQLRLRLIDELITRTTNSDTLEVQELQPLFHQGLWIFGPEFETIEFTSNLGMTAVIQDLFGRPDIKGSRNRPDFAIIPDGSVGLYTYPEFSNDDGAEIGPAKLVIVELKAPAVKVTDKEKGQCYQYIRELAEKGLLTARTRVQAFVLGRFINQIDREERTEMAGRVKILPIDFETILQRAKSRLLNLYDKIRTAPFLQQQGIDKFLDPNAELSQVNLELEESVKARSPN